VSADETRSRTIGPLLAGLLCLAVLGFRAYQNRDVFYDRFNLPAFDGHIYAAMAEEPAVFTVAPWGYRLLMPWLVHVSPWNAARGFGRLTTAALLFSGLAAFAMLRRLGSGTIGSALAAAALLASDPVARILRYRLLVEPMTLLLETLFLLALASRVSWPVLAIVGVLGTASKEFFLLLLPAVFLSRWTDGRRRAALETAAVIVPSLAFTLILRWWWTPYLSSPPVGFPPIGERVRSWAVTQPGSLALLAIAAAVAAFGAVRPQARGWRWAFVYVAAVAFAAPFLNPSDFSAPDLPRLHVYVLPALLPFVLLALDRVWRHAIDAAPAEPTPRAAAIASLVATAAAVLSPFVLLDRYRRVDLRGDGDAARVLSTCRGTLMAAGRLARGEEVAQDAVRGADETGEPRLRWFLRDGWEAGDGAAVMTGRTAALILPMRPPRALEVELVFAGEPPLGLRASLDGRPLEVERAGEGLRLVLSAAALVRGDNLLTLDRGTGGPPPQLRRLRLRPVP
jgi:hypothetical protein